MPNRATLIVEALTHPAPSTSKRRRAGQQTRHVAGYYTEATPTGKGCGSCGCSSRRCGLGTPPACGGATRTPPEQRDSCQELAARTASAGGYSSSNSTNSNTKKADGLMRNSNERGDDGHERGHGPSPQLICRQVARNLVKPRHMDYMEFLPTFTTGGGAASSPPAAAAAAVVAAGTAGETRNAQPQPWREASEGAEPGMASTARGQRGGGAMPALSPMEAAVATECLVSLLAAHGTVQRLATGPQVTTALKREGFPDAAEALALLKDSDALRGRGVRDRLWRLRRGAALVRVRAEESLFARLPSELFQNVLMFLAS